MGWDLNPGFYVSALGGDVQGSGHRRNKKKGTINSWGGSPFSPGYPRVLESPHHSNLPVSKPVTGSAAFPLPHSPTMVSLFFKGRNGGPGSFSNYPWANTEEEAGHPISRRCTKSCAALSPPPKGKSPTKTNRHNRLDKKCFSGRKRKCQTPQNSELVDTNS